MLSLILSFAHKFPVFSGYNYNVDCSSAQWYTYGRLGVDTVTIDPARKANTGYQQKSMGYL